MSAPSKLTEKQIESGLAGLDGWTLVDGKVHKSFQFEDFVEAFAFMTRVAFVAEKSNHHPEWSNVYNRVTIDLTTHDAGGVSQKDLDFARAVEGLRG